MAGKLPFTVSLRAGQPIAEQVIHAVSRAIVTGQLRPGDPFPSVRALSVELKINPNTAHRIVTALVDDRLLTVVTGVGTVVTDPRRAGDPARLLDSSQIERLVVEARLLGLTLQQLNETIREHWSRTSRRAG